MSFIVRSLVVGTVVILLMTGCGKSPSNPAGPEYAFKDLRLGMTKDEVRKAMGREPDDLEKINNRKSTGNSSIVILKPLSFEQSPPKHGSGQPESWHYVNEGSQYKLWYIQLDFIDKKLTDAFMIVPSVVSLDDKTWHFIEGAYEDDLVVLEAGISDEEGFIKIKEGLKKLKSKNKR